MESKTQEELLLTDEEMAEVQGDKDACLAVIRGFGSCKGCSANCHAIAQAQLSKVLEAVNAKIDNLKIAIASLNKKLDDREADLKETKREERERIFDWGSSPCKDPKHATGGYFYATHSYFCCKRDCYECWQSLKSGKE